MDLLHMTSSIFNLQCKTFEGIFLEKIFINSVILHESRKKIYKTCLKSLRNRGRNSKSACLCKHYPVYKGNKKTLPSYRKRYWKNDNSETSVALFSPSLLITQGTDWSPAKVRHEITEINGATNSNHCIIKYQTLFFHRNSTNVNRQ